ncbi:hypothetical protein D1007_21292 [Hordeum vulgare]|nr:hypothetical protein D1007_21292 [Hordeum vulgare]
MPPLHLAFPNTVSIHVMLHHPRPHLLVPSPEPHPHRSNLVGDIPIATAAQSSRSSLRSSPTLTIITIEITIIHHISQTSPPMSETPWNRRPLHHRTPATSTSPELSLDFNSATMEIYTLNERGHYEDVLEGPFLMELVHMMKLPIPEVKVTKRKSGFWGVGTKVFGRKDDPKTEDINYRTFTHDCDMGMNTADHDAIARLSYLHRVELGTHYFGRLGWQKREGAHIILTDEQKVKFSPVLVYNQELEHYIKNLQMDLLSELFENDALRESLKTEKLKLKSQLLELQGRHQKLHVNREYLAEELEKTKHDQKKPTDDEVMM